MRLSTDSMDLSNGNYDRDYTSQLQQFHCRVHGKLKALQPYQASSDHIMTGLYFASGSLADLQVAWVPQLVKFDVEEYDGLERVVFQGCRQCLLKCLQG